MTTDFIADFKRNSPCMTLIIAEAGVHHGCDLDKGRKLIDAAADSGADIIKFQTYKSESLVTSWAPVYWGKPDKTGSADTQFEYFKKRDKFEAEDYRSLFDHAGKRGILCCSTPFDLQSLALLEALGVPLWKVASADIDNFPLLEGISKTGKPVLLSTGAAYLDEVKEAVDFLKNKGVRHIALLHCNLAYPTPEEDANLMRIGLLKKRFPEVVLGYSDHTIPDNSMTIPAIAVALGARIIEKHFTLDRSLPEDDHLHSVDPAMMKRMINSIRIAEQAVSASSEVTQSEIPARNFARRSLVAAEDIPAGARLTPKNILPKRPGNGISPKHMDRITGRRTRNPIEKDRQLSWDDIE